MNPIIENIYNQSKLNYKKIVLTEGDDNRIIEAVKIIRDQKIADVIVLGKNCDIDPESSPLLDQFTQTLFDLRKEKGLTIDEANKLAKNPLYFGTLMVHLGLADGMVSGAKSTTAETFKPALQIIKASSTSKMISSFFIMETNNSNLGEQGILFFSDCGLNINPSAEELSEIAIETAKSFNNLAQKTPRIAMLSFSTNGSAKGEMVDKVKLATDLVKQKNPNLIVEGEMQGDAALVPDICDSKFSGNNLHGQANILIFPDLNSGNIAYKLVQRIANAKAYGPLSQGIKKPINDLSRGCSIEDIVTTVAITSVQN
ncbi:MAG: phosphate acetyltransferase [Candidatus Shapirobacteria bacterium]|nr:phosphate acetyltransferase [Candidatus Shapirobacteria bacterium]MDD3002286.1 phosphate acetyltransferase [Candidatus Shapirobacteria bacterium]MDD4382709.1 phosphate acetyltransferase [Candidatus Shapirobacteria bacterium]